MSTIQLHIVTHDVPYPVSHGGFFDLFYKLKALQEVGVAIHLHCFTYDRAPQEELNRYCVSVKYYPRKKKISRLSFRLPFIVNSRISEELITDLNKDDHPVLFEGIHTTYPLYSERIGHRKLLVRLHNAEFEYYRQLGKHEKNPIKKWYFAHESKLLKKYEQTLAEKAIFLAVSKQDVELYQREFNAKQVYHLPVFLPYSLAVGREGKGCFCLYHGNLSVNENEEAVNWLLCEVLKGSTIPLVIAGKDPSKKLAEMAKAHTNTCLCANPSDKELQDLICKAQVNVLPSFNSTGIKLKLLNALFNGRHCLVNSAAVAGTGLENYCNVADDAASFLAQTASLFKKDFTEAEVQKRQGLLQTEFNNAANTKKLIAFLS
ncbi:MAG TPA: glycosyltransferase [Ferruginibacter sp.]|nr:glycosyltransferase [Ferruginibacter sp.]